MHPPAIPIFEHPEIEHLDFVDLKNFLREENDVETSVDVVEVWRVQIGQPSLDGFTHRHRQNLPHVALVDHLSNFAEEDAQLALRILFLKSVPRQGKRGDEERVTASIDDTQVALSKLTVDFLITELGVCPLFLSTISSVPWVLDAGSALFKTFDPTHSDEVVSAKGFYHCSDSGKPVRTWFHHDLSHQRTTYIIHGCPDRVKSTIQHWAMDAAHRQDILRPLAVDTLLIDDVTWAWSRAVVESTKKLLAYENLSKKENQERIDSAVQTLHHLSQHFHILQEELERIVEQLDFLLELHDMVLSSMITVPSASVADSLRLLRSRTYKWHRCVINWKERTQIRIHLFFNLSAQRDNVTNMNIAQLTSEIAKATYRDSSSMITIAVLTLFFLPGTFVSGVLGMPFTESLTSRPSAGWLLYAAITTPLTITVIVAWMFWRWLRDKHEPRLIGIDDPIEKERAIAARSGDEPEAKHGSPGSDRGEETHFESPRSSEEEGKGSFYDSETHSSPGLDDGQERIDVLVSPRTPPSLSRDVPRFDSSDPSTKPNPDVLRPLGNGGARLTLSPAHSVNLQNKLPSESASQSPADSQGTAGVRTYMTEELTTEDPLERTISSPLPSAPPDTHDKILPEGARPPPISKGDPKDNNSSAMTVEPFVARPRSFTVGTPSLAPPAVAEHARGRSLDRTDERRGLPRTHKRSASHQVPSLMWDSTNLGMPGRSRAAFDPSYKFVGHGAWAKEEASPVAPPEYSPPLPISKRQMRKMRSRSLGPQPSLSSSSVQMATIPMSRRVLSPTFQVAPMLQYGRRSPRSDLFGPTSHPMRPPRVRGRTRDSIPFMRSSSRRHTRSASPGRPVFIHAQSTTDRDVARHTMRVRSQSPRRLQHHLSPLPRHTRRSRSRSNERDLDSNRHHERRVRRPPRIEAKRRDKEGGPKYSSTPSPSFSHIPLPVFAASISESTRSQRWQAQITSTGHGSRRPTLNVVQPKPMKATSARPLPSVTSMDFRSNSAEPMHSRISYFNRSPSPLQLQLSQGESSFSGTSTLVQRTASSTDERQLSYDWTNATRNQGILCEQRHSDLLHDVAETRKLQDSAKSPPVIVFSRQALDDLDVTPLDRFNKRRSFSTDYGAENMLFSHDTARTL